MKETTNTACCGARLIKSPKRLILATLGIFFVVLAGIGAVVPGMPTTVFLLCASYCFTRSCPWLEERVMRLRIFAPYAGFIDPKLKISDKSRLRAIMCMWLCILFSIMLILIADTCPDYVASMVAILGLIGTIAIWKFRRTMEI